MLNDQVLAAAASTATSILRSATVDQFANDHVSQLFVIVSGSCQPRECSAKEDLLLVIFSASSITSEVPLIFHMIAAAPAVTAVANAAFLK